MAKSLTRNDTRHSLFGNPAKFPSSQLLLKKRSIFAFRIPSIPNHSARKYSTIKFRDSQASFEGCDGYLEPSNNTYHYRKWSSEKDTLLNT